MLRIDLSGTASAARVIPQTPGLAQQCDDQQRPSGIGDNAGPTDNRKRAVSKANIMNQKDTDGKQYAASDEKDGQQFLAWSRESDKRLQQCEKQRTIPPKISKRRALMGPKIGAAVDDIALLAMFYGCFSYIHSLSSLPLVLLLFRVRESCALRAGCVVMLFQWSRPPRTSDWVTLMKGWFSRVGENLEQRRWEQSVSAPTVTTSNAAQAESGAG